MRRREFIVGLGSTAAWPLPAQAQEARKPPTIGFLGAAGPSASWVTAFVQRLAELGWVEGRTIAIEVRWAEGRGERFAEIAAEFVRRNVDVILTYAVPGVRAAKQASSSIPIVFAAAGDPVGTGLVESLARPGGNVTGFSLQQTDLAGKRLELLREAVPGLRRLAVIANVNNPFAMREMDEVLAAARTLDLDIGAIEIRSAQDIALALQSLDGRAQALYVVGDPLTNSNRLQINALALATRLPGIYNGRENVETGGLMSCGPHFPDLFRRAADYVDKILKGAKAGDLPVEQPTRFELVFNLKTAKALGLEVPPLLLARADEIIE